MEEEEEACKIYLQCTNQAKMNECSAAVHGELLEPQRVKPSAPSVHVLHHSTFGKVAPEMAATPRDAGGWQHTAERRRVDVKVQGEDGIFLQQRSKPSASVCVCVCVSAAARSAVPLDGSGGNNDSLSRQRVLAEQQPNTEAQCWRSAAVVLITVVTFNLLVNHRMISS